MFYERLSNCAKQEASLFEKLCYVLQGLLVTTVKEDSDKEEEEEDDDDEVIVFKPTAAEKHSELNIASTSQQNPVASSYSESDSIVSSSRTSASTLQLTFQYKFLGILQH